MTENGIDYSSSPEKNASPEQLRFMVDLDEDRFFAPCSDWMLFNLLNIDRSDALLSEYKLQWKKYVFLVRSYIKDSYTRKKIIALSRHKFHQVLETSFLIPSRLIKQLITIFLSQCAIEDPLFAQKCEMNRRAYDFLHGHEFGAFINACPRRDLPCESISSLRWSLNLLELKRLMSASLCNEIWQDQTLDTPLIILCDRLFASLGEVGDQLRPLLDPDLRGRLNILFLPDRAGGLVFDIEIVKVLNMLGHRVILALKSGFYFDTTSLWDLGSDPILSEIFKSSYLVDKKDISKKDLLNIINTHGFVTIGDGTRERLNLYRTSLTFARAWKECDVVIAKGERNHRRLFLNSYQFTRDIFFFYRAGDRVEVVVKPKSARVRKYSEKDIMLMADSIIATMRKKRLSGEMVVFYSGIIGSIPGQTKMAIKLLNVFVEYLRKKLEGALIINPAEHFAPGMDGDDLMYMWERVQRSGYIDVWRFQTVSDIEKSFELLGEKVPSVWTGKDATYSTGCTKEMGIALSVQKEHPEMQIIGPDPVNFFRRKEYGVGKYFDAGLHADFSRGLGHSPAWSEDALE